MDEWKRHASRYARTWRVSMHARRLIAPVVPAECADILTLARQPGRLSSQQIAAVEKDIHLIAAARSADQVILSLDHRMKTILTGLAALTKTLDRVIWSDPDKNHAPLCRWLREGEPPLPTLNA